MPTEKYGSPNPNTDEHGLEKPTPHPSPKFDAEHPGYETTDVNTRGVAVFLAGLFTFVIVFFFLCLGMGKAINTSLLKQDGDQAALNPLPVTASGQPAPNRKGVNLANNPYLEQKESARIAQSFPSPRLDADDGNQPTSDLHVREDLLLDHASVDKDGTVRIPIDQAMALIAQRGLPQAAATEAKPLMVGEKRHLVVTPLTNGFARTSYELEQRESREQKMKITGEGSGESAEKK